VWLLLKLQLQLLWGSSVTEENEPECRLELENTKGYACGLKASVRLGTCAYIGMGIGIWNGVGITLLDGVRECARAGSFNASLDDARGEDGRTGRVSGRSTLSSLGLEIMSSSTSGRGCDSKEVRGSELTGG
jgi:hypothetical protein